MKPLKDLFCSKSIKINQIIVNFKTSADRIVNKKMNKKYSNKNITMQTL